MIFIEKPWLIFGLAIFVVIVGTMSYQYIRYGESSKHPKRDEENE
jgi:hypothetical protein